MALTTCATCGGRTVAQWQLCDCATAVEHQHWVFACPRCRTTTYDTPCADRSKHRDTPQWGRCAG